MHGRMHPNQGNVTKLFAVDPLPLLAYLTVSSTNPVTGNQPRLLGNGKQMYIHLYMYTCTYICWKLLGPHVWEDLYWLLFSCYTSKRWQIQYCILALWVTSNKLAAKPRQASTSPYMPVWAFVHACTHTHHTCQPQHKQTLVVGSNFTGFNWFSCKPKITVS